MLNRSLMVVLLIAGLINTTPAGADDKLTTIARVELGRKILCQPSYHLYFRGTQQKAVLAATNKSCDYQFADYEKDELIEDLQKMAEWVETAKKANIDFEKNYVGPSSGVPWVFVSFEDGNSFAFLNSSRKSQALWSIELQDFLRQVQKNYDEKEAKHRSTEDPFK